MGHSSVDSAIGGGLDLAMSEEPEDAGGSKPIRVYLLDDHEIVRRGLRELLESEGDIVVVGESGLAAEAARRIPALRPDVAILDGRLPDGSGIELCREIRSRVPGITALILTSYDDDDELFAAIMAGASGYILKQVGGNDLVDSVRRAAAGQSTLDPAVTAAVLERVRNGARTDPALKPLPHRSWNPPADRRGHDEPSDGREHDPGREDHQELRLVALVQAGPRKPDAGSDFLPQAPTGVASQRT